MIIPWLKGFVLWAKAPLTWTLVGLNVFIFMLTYQPEKRSLANQFSGKNELHLTGLIYAQYLAKTAHKGTPQAEPVRQRTLEEWVLLGSQGLRDPQFLNQAIKMDFEGDEIAIRDWKSSLEKFQAQFQMRSSHLFGLLNYQNRPLTWITYQFMHAGMVHLFSNMALLLIFAAGLEALIGGGGLVLVYLLSGLAGGLGFLLLSQYSVAPMVGASGALSGVMACYAAFEKRKRVPFFYFLSPIDGYFGIIHLPTWLIFPLCFLTDVASYLSTPAELGSGIAYTAHIGGAVFGALIGFTLKAMGFHLPNPQSAQSHV